MYWYHSWLWATSLISPLIWAMSLSIYHSPYGKLFFSFAILLYHRNDLKIICILFICSSFIFLVKFRLPFEWNTPFAYLIAFSIQTASYYCCCSCSVSCLILLVGSGDTLQTLSKDVKNELHALNEAKKTDNPMEFKQKMYTIIELLANVRKWVRWILMNMNILAISIKWFEKILYE